jgi:hypothetical protein
MAETCSVNMCHNWCRLFVDRTKEKGGGQIFLSVNFW